MKLPAKKRSREWVDLCHFYSDHDHWSGVKPVCNFVPLKAFFHNKNYIK